VALLIQSRASDAFELEGPAGAMTYVRESNKQGDRRHLPEKLQD
jgi:hypothetical protein